MKLSTTLEALLHLGLFTASSVSATTGPSLRGPTAGRRKLPPMIKDDEVAATSEESYEFTTAEDTTVRLIEMHACQTVTSIQRDMDLFISTTKGSTECLADPVNGCAGGCCRDANAYFVCDNTGTEAPILPCVCNSLTADPTTLSQPSGGGMDVSSAAAPTRDIVETSVAAASFNTLVDLVTVADLVETLQSPGPFTVFAPLDSAFPSGMALEEFKNTTDLETLTSILTFHVVPGEIFASNLTEGATVTTVEGTNLTFSLKNGPMVNNANIVATDILAENGVIHVIDTMLDPSAPTKDIVDTATAAANFNTLVDLVVTAGLVDVLQSPGPFTVFAPLDSAFPTGEALEEFKNTTDIQTLTAILTYHVVPGKVMSKDLAEGLSVETVQGSNVTFSLMSTSGNATINDANIVAVDIETSNGVIHAIDTVLMPVPVPAPAGGPTTEGDVSGMVPVPVPVPAPAPAEAPLGEDSNVVEAAIGAGEFTTLVDLLGTAGLVEILQSPGPFTVFAPRDSAFPTGAALEEFKSTTDMETLTAILTYHVIPQRIMSTDLSDGLSLRTIEGSSVTFSLPNGGGAMINDANIVTVDIETSNGVIHVIDTVLMPVPAPAPANGPMDDTPVDTTTNTDAIPVPAPAPVPATGGMDLVDTAIAAGSFTILADLLMEAGLVATLQGDGPFTVFAPTDAAFESLDELEEIRALPAATLSRILTYHVVPGLVKSTDLSNGQEVTTVEGSTVVIAIDDDDVSINDAGILETDILASNGIIHVIDEVLLPPGLEDL